jgi:hypothetical protein
LCEYLRPFSFSRFSGHKLVSHSGNIVNASLRIARGKWMVKYCSFTDALLLALRFFRPGSRNLGVRERWSHLGSADHPFQSSNLALAGVTDLVKMIVSHRWGNDSKAAFASANLTLCDPTCAQEKVRSHGRFFRLHPPSQIARSEPNRNVWAILKQQVQ